jgi:TPR repeat protein
MRRRSIFCLLALWMLTTASSCQTSFDGGGSSFSASGTAAGVTVAALVVVGGVYCLAHWDDCFPDEEALRARAEEQAKARAAFAAGLRRWRTGDPDGLRWICLSAHQGFANAQYLYGVHLVMHEPRDIERGKRWLRRAALQGHREAEIVLQQGLGGAPDTGTVDPAMKDVEIPEPESCGDPDGIASTGLPHAHAG